MDYVKSILLALAISLGLGLGSVYAQDKNQSKEVEVEVEGKHTDHDGVKAEVDVETDQREKSRAGEALSTVGSGAKKAGNGIVDAAEWSVETVADGVSWTWDKAKHNKLTKNLFNQPGDE